MKKYRITLNTGRVAFCLAINEAVARTIFLVMNKEEVAKQKQQEKQLQTA